MQHYSFHMKVQIFITLTVSFCFVIHPFNAVNTFFIAIDEIDYGKCQSNRRLLQDMWYAFCVIYTSGSPFVTCVDLEIKKIQLARAQLPHASYDAASR
ncbi:MAG: hypothetical protein Q8S22_00420 [Eubacteriales bacterium]|nr:hypothetical protein [Eubacteriales bacterium]